VNFHPRLEDVQVARNENGDKIGWIGRLGEGYTFILPNTKKAEYGLMSVSAHTGDGNFETREAAHRMLTGMFERPELYGFEREDWAELWR